MKRLASLFVTVTTLLFAAFVYAPQASAQIDPGEPGDPGFYICHATGADGHWVRNDPANAGDAAGHIGLSHQDGLDIVPPFTAPDGSTMSQNWNEDTAAIYYNNCQALPAPSPTDVPPTATEVPPTATATDVPPTATATDVPATATATATTVPGQPTATDVPPTATDVPNEPTQAPSQPEPTKAAPAVSVLPSTGSDGGASSGGQALILLTAAAATIMAGAGAILSTRSRGR